MLQLFHVVVMLIAIILMSLWMLVILISIIESEILNKIAERWKPLAAIFLVMILGFISRIWYLTAMDVQDFVNYIFGSCEPINISKF